MTLLAHDLDTVYVYVDGSRILPALGSNAGHQDGTPPPLTLPNFSYTNTDLNTTHIVTLDLHDDSALPLPCDSFSNGPNAFASPLRHITAHRSASGLSELADEIFINDGETHPGCLGVPSGPFGDSSNFGGLVSITPTP
jgi:hypothetical protein